jgi:hypothetical protein
MKPGGSQTRRLPSVWNGEVRKISARKADDHSQTIVLQVGGD